MQPKFNLLNNRLVLTLCLVFSIGGCLSKSFSVNAVELPQAESNKRLSRPVQYQGNLIRAIQVWQRQSEKHRDNSNVEEEAKTLLEVARAYNKLGNFDVAINKLNYIISLNINNAQFNALVLENIGNSFQGKGRYKKAIDVYQKSLKLNNSLSCLNNLVKTQILLIERISVELRTIKEKRYLESEVLKKEGYYEDGSYTDSYLINKLEKQIESQKNSAFKKATEAINFKTKTSKTSLSKVYAAINWYKVTSKPVPKNLLFSISKLLESELPSRTLVFSMIEWSKVDGKNNIYWLEKAKEIADSIRDSVAQSHATFELSQYYYDRKDFQSALQYAQDSQIIAQSHFLVENLYQTQWLLGKIYRNLEQYHNSITAYRNAVATTNVVSQNISSWNFVQKANYRLNIKPLYRELIDLLLEQEEVNDRDIEQAIDIAGQLRFSELEDYFGDDCFEVRNLNLHRAVKKNEATFFSILLDDKTYIILKLPDGSLHLNKLNVSKFKIQEIAVLWRENLTAGNTNRYQIQSQKLYDLIIRPFEQKLELSKFEVLVFVHDGILRNLPMPALYDGDLYLAQKWASVSSLGLNVLTKKPKSVEDRVLIFGLSQSNFIDWSDLKMVDREVNLVHKIIGGQKYLNNDFTVDNLNDRLNEKFFSVVHLASHGYFAGNAKDSFLLAYDSQISILDLENILQNQTIIDLLVLSACETAITDNSLLGLAGVAARNGVKSILGTLWLVQDDIQTETIKNFYIELKKTNNKAIALQKVQQKFISQYAHPQSWAALSLIGDY